MKYLMLILLVLILPLASAVRVDLFLNQSYSKYDKNITLIDISKNKALVCINNEKAILSEEKPKTVNDVNFEVKQVFSDKIKVEIKVYCQENCECTDLCSNSECLENFNNKEIEEEIQKENVVLETLVDAPVEVIQNQSPSSFNLIVAFVILLIIISAVYYLLKRR